MNIFTEKLSGFIILVLSVLSGLSLLALKYYYWQILDVDMFQPVSDLWLYLLIPYFIVFALSLAYVYFNSARLLSFVPVVVCVLAATGVLYVPYELRYADVYNAFSSDGHHRKHNKFEIIDKLKNREYKWLDEYFLKAHEVVNQAPNEEHYLNDAYSVFVNKRDTSFRGFLDEWVAKRKSFQAYTARGFYLVSRGWKTRGEVFYRDIPAKNKVEMKPLFRGAVSDLNKALEINSENVSAYMQLIMVYGVQGNTSKADDVLESALKLYPNAYYIRDRYMTYHLYPQWGGSLEKMYTFAMQARKYTVYNPRLNGLMASVYKRQAGLFQQKKDFKNSVRLYEKSLEYAPFNSVYMALARIYYGQKRYDLQRVQYENILKKSPYHFNALASLLNYKIAEGNTEGALNDANIILKYDDSSWSLTQAVRAFETLGKNAQAIQSYHRILLDDRKSEYAYDRLIGHYVISGKTKEALDVALIYKKELPEKLAGWLYAADFSYQLNMPISLEYIRKYFKLIDSGVPEKENYKVAAAQLRIYIEEKYGDKKANKVTLAPKI